MKKLLAVLLSVLLVLGLTATAFAADDDETGEAPGDEPMVTVGAEPDECGEIDITVYMPLCGTEVNGDNLADAAEVYVDPEGVQITELTLAQDFDVEELTGEPFTGVIEGDEQYAFLMTLEAEEGFDFYGEVCWALLADGDEMFFSAQSETVMRVAVVCTAEHDWGEWELVQEPTEDEDGLWQRVCQGDPDHVETEIAPAGEDPVEPGTVGPVLHEVEIDLYFPVCGQEITEENSGDVIWPYYYPEEIISTVSCELVTDYDMENPADRTPFVGTVIGGEEYVALLTFAADEDHTFAPDVEICLCCLEDASFEILEQTEERITLAISFTAEHDWDDWEMVEEPTEESDGLWQRVCLYDPDHVETETIPALTSGQIPEAYIDLTFPCCGYEVEDPYLVEDETIYVYGDGVFFESGKLVSDYDPEHPKEAEPFVGTATGGETYTALITLRCGDGRWFDEDTEFTVGYPYDVDVEILEMTDHTVTLAASAEAEHDWGEWYVAQEPTEDEDGLWMRVSQSDPTHVETEIIPAGTEPVYPVPEVDPERPTDPDDPWDPDEPNLFALELEVMAPVCGDEITEDNRQEAVWVYPWPEDTVIVEHCELVTDYDPDDPAVFTPFIGTVIGGEEYTFLLTIVPDEDHYFEEDMAVGFYEDFLYDWVILEQTDSRLILAVTFTAEHDWDEWYVAQEPTEDEDGLWMRVCLYDPNHAETEIIPAGTDPDAPWPEYGEITPTDEPTVPGGVDIGRDVPNTGDSSNLPLWCAAAVLSLAALVAVIVVWKKRRDDR